MAKNTRANRHLIRSKNRTNHDTMVNRQVLKIKKKKSLEGFIAWLNHRFSKTGLDKEKNFCLEKELF